MDHNFAMVVFGMVVVALAAMAMGRHVRTKLDENGMMIATKPNQPSPPPIGEMEKNFEIPVTRRR